GRNLGFPLATTSARCAPSGRQTEIPNYDKGALIRCYATCARGRGLRINTETAQSVWRHGFFFASKDKLNI
ncbi:MAG: hypothetical protein FWC97_04325, partial [Treponema sp.]|nr:hypothetical protein [Treponema sp.]